MPKRALTASPPSLLPKITPIRLLERAAPFDDPNYLFELKYDGLRAVAYIEHGTTKLTQGEHRVRSYRSHPMT